MKYLPPLQTTLISFRHVLDNLQEDQHSAGVLEKGEKPLDDSPAER